ncbi:helix-turn-helix domain-containing protein [Falsiroseomonas sp. HW251]|uniref:helix-turn-helix domain-containing protein n=1 Tax=Falsiroseomonas sp. HW251 TaxID=3390998 RepID=UPI003D317ACC
MEQAVLSCGAASEIGVASIAVAPAAGSGAEPPRIPQTLPQVEREALVRALDEAGGNVSRAARSLGISRDTMRYRMAKHGLDQGMAQAAD